MRAQMHTCKDLLRDMRGVLLSAVLAAVTIPTVLSPSLQVNSVDVRSARHETAVSLLIERRETITLLVCHVPPPPGLQEITLVKGLHDKLGLSIRGGMKTDYTDEGGIYISKVARGWVGRGGCEGGDAKRRKRK